MWQIIKSLFQKQKKIKDPVDLTNSIIFNIDKNNQINLSVDIKNQSTEAAKKFGLLLFLLNEGYYVQSFLDIISDLSKTNSGAASFQQNVINTWSSKITESNEYEKSNSDDSENSPIIKPTQFNHTNNKS